MEDPIDLIQQMLLENEYDELRKEIDHMIDKTEWGEIVRILKIAIESFYQKHWLKINHVVLTLFGVPELLGVDCDIFQELEKIKGYPNVAQVSGKFYDSIIRFVKKQVKQGGSTLFFNLEKISSTQSAIMLSDLIQARSCETILVLQEIDEMLPRLTKEWVDISRLWRTSNGYRLLKAQNSGTHIHVSEYRKIRDNLLDELNTSFSEIKEKCESDRIHGSETYLQLSKGLDDFMTGLIASLGIRGKFDQYYKSWIDHEGLDNF